MIGSIFKIFRPDEWRDIQITGVFVGSVHDQRDGFIHLSTGEQLAGTLLKHFSNDPVVIVAQVDERDIASDLKWDVSRGGHKFPHLFAPLPVSALVKHIELAQTDADGFKVPADL